MTKAKRQGGGEPVGDEEREEMAAELKPGDFAIVFHVDGDVEVFAAEGATPEQATDTRLLVDYIEFVLNDDESWGRYARIKGEENEGRGKPPPGTLLN